MHQLNKFDHNIAISAIDKLQKQARPLLAESVYKKASLHEIMVFDTVTLNAQSGKHIGHEGLRVTFVCVKAKDTWAAYYKFGPYSPEHVAKHGHKLSKSQISSLIDCEGELIEHYRK